MSALMFTTVFCLSDSKMTNNVVITGVRIPDLCFSGGGELIGVWRLVTFAL